VQCSQWRIQDFGMGGHWSSAEGASIEAPRVEAPQAPREVGFGEGVSPSPMWVGSGEGAVPPLQKMF